MVHTTESGTRTIYHCIQGPSVARYADTETEAVKWLEGNGGGVYRNSLHRFDMPVRTPATKAVQ